MKVGIIGAGKFGRAITRLIEKYPADLEYLLFDKTPIAGATVDFTGLKECDWIIPAVPISAFETVLRNVRPFLRPDSVMMDVCTVKVFPVRLMRDILPKTVGIVASHPLFGPETLERSGYRLEGLPLMLWPVRISTQLFHSLKTGLRNTGLKVMEMAPEEHDRLMARSQFVTLLTGNLLKRLQLQPTPIDTYSFSTLLEVCAVTGDDFDILRDVYRFNPNCRELLREFEEATEQVLKAIRVTDPHSRD